MAKRKPKTTPISRKEVIARVKELAILIQETPKFKTVKRMGKDSIPDVPSDTLKEMLNFLRCGIKYQLFDLNASRMENEFLRKICKENGIDV